MTEGLIDVFVTWAESRNIISKLLETNAISCKLYDALRGLYEALEGFMKPHKALLGFMKSRKAFLWKNRLANRIQVTVARSKICCHGPSQDSKND